MGWVFAMTLPGLVVGLVVLAAIDRLVTRRRGRSSVSGVGLDVFGGALAPGRRHLTDERDHQALVREDDTDGAPRRTSVDLQRNVVVVRLPDD